MIQFNELRITPDSKCIIIDAQISDEDYFKDMYIESVVIDNQNTFNVTGPSSNPIYQTEIDSTDKCFKVSKKRIRLYLKQSDLDFTRKINLADNIFFVYIIAGGTPSPDTPCGRDENIRLGTVVNLYPLYQKSMTLVKELNNKCDIPHNFIDIILRLKAFELAIKTGSYNKAITLWDTLIKKDNKGITINKCNCNAST